MAIFAKQWSEARHRRCRQQGQWAYLVRNHRQCLLLIIFRPCLVSAYLGTNTA